MSFDVGLLKETLCKSLCGDVQLRTTKQGLLQVVTPFLFPDGDVFQVYLEEARMVEARAEGGQTGLDVPEAFPPGQLGESQDQEMLVGGEFADAVVAVITGDTLVELVLGEEVQQLGEDGAALVHRWKTRWLAGNHPRKPREEMKSKKAATLREAPFRQAKIKPGKT